MAYRWEAHVNPKNMVAAFCMPASKDAYMEQIQDRSNRDFVEACLRIHGKPPTAAMFERYQSAVLEPLEAAISVFNKTGVRVVKEVTLAEFGHLLANQACDCLMLFAHMRESPADPDAGRVEFYDGLASFDAFIQQVPKDYEGVLDLVVCNSRRLSQRMRDERPLTSPLKYEDCTRHVRLAFLFEAAVAKFLSENQSSYYAAVIACSRFKPPGLIQSFLHCAGLGRKKWIGT